MVRSTIARAGSASPSTHGTSGHPIRSTNAGSESIRSRTRERNDGVRRHARSAIVPVTVDRMREFYERAGYRVTTTKAGHWYVPGSRGWKNFPCGQTIAPSADEVAALARRQGMLGVEFFNARGIGVQSGLWMLRDPSYGAHSLRRQFRQHV